jgi:hypothetical protein
VHVLGDGQLGDLVAEQGEFGPNAPAAPRRILSSTLSGSKLAGSWWRFRKRGGRHPPPDGAGRVLPMAPPRIRPVLRVPRPLLRRRATDSTSARATVGGDYVVHLTESTTSGKPLAVVQDAFYAAAVAWRCRRSTSLGSTSAKPAPPS